MIEQIIDFVVNSRFSHIIYGILTFLVGVIIIKRLEGLIEKNLKKRMHPGMAKNMSRLSYYGLFFFLAVISLDVGGLKVQSLLVAGGIVGMAIGFASKETVSNLISGLFLYFDRPFDIGDYVEVGKTGGTVLDITPLSTRLRTGDGPIVRLPNDKVFAAEIKNYKRVAARRFTHTIKVGYNSGIDNVIELIKEVLDAESFVLKNPKPSIYLNNLGDSALEIVVKAWTPAAKNFSAKTKILREIYETLNKNKIEIPGPQLEVKIRD